MIKEIFKKRSDRVVIGKFCLIIFMLCKMADRDVATLFQQLAGLSTVVGTQGIAQIVHPFEGDSKKFKD